MGGVPRGSWVSQSEGWVRHGMTAPSQSVSQHHRVIQEGKEHSGVKQGHAKAHCTGLCPAGSWIRILEYLCSIGVNQWENTGTAA